MDSRRRLGRPALDAGAVAIVTDGTGVDAVRGLEDSELKTVFLSSDRSDGAVLAALEAGACGYLVKAEPLDQLVSAVRRAGMAGHSAGAGRRAGTADQSSDARNTIDAMGVPR